MITKDIVLEAEALLSNGRSIRYVGKLLGMSRQTVASIAMGDHPHQRPTPRPRKVRVPESWQQPAYLPTPEQIEAACQEFQRRRRLRRRRWRVPVIAVSEVS